MLYLVILKTETNVVNVCQDKLGELQTLVMQLMGEKNMLHSYQQESVRPQSPSIHPPHINRHQHTGKHSIMQGNNTQVSIALCQVTTHR